MKSVKVAVVIAIALALAGCSGPHGEPVTADNLSKTWVAMGGSDSDTASGSFLTADELAAVDPAECGIVENAWSGSPYGPDDVDVDDPGMSGNLASPSAAVAAEDTAQPSAPLWVASARVFASVADATAYMDELAAALPNCSTYQVAGGEPVDVAAITWDTGDLDSVAFNEVVVVRDENVAYTFMPSSVTGENVQADLNAFVSVLTR